MYRKSPVVILSLCMMVIVACSKITNLPGTGGTDEADQIGQTDHMEVPEGVSCYVCHKSDIPQAAFHEGYGNDCAECHENTTWMAVDYSHPAWPLDENHRTRCTRCHTAAGRNDYSEYQCWGCHHRREEMTTLHANLGYDDISECVECHTGADAQ